MDDDIEHARTRAVAQPTPIAPQASGQLPAVVPPPTSARGKRPWRGYAALFAVLALGGLGAGFWWLHSGTALPPGIVYGNGRLEADEIDIDTKFAGRIAKLFVDEGDVVKAGQVIAVMDTKDLQAQQEKSMAVMRQSQQALSEAENNLLQQQSQV